MIRGFTRRFQPVEFLRPEETQAIYHAALFVLGKTGMRIEHERALTLLADHGCKVSLDDMRVRFPPSIIEESIRKAPSSYMIEARDRDLDLMVGGNTVLFMQGMGMRFVDTTTWETRPATLSEHKEAMIVADALDNLHLADGVFSYTEIEDVPPCMTMLENLASGLRYSSKAEHFGYQKDSEIFAMKMAEELGINLNCELDAASPLTIYRGAIDAAFGYIEKDNPICPWISMTMGAEGPATFAGSAVIALAAAFAWIVLTQLIKPGSAISIGHSIRAMDMRTGQVSFGNVTHSISTVLMNQLLREHKIPSISSAGFTSTSKKIDYQSGYQKALGALVDALSGSNVQIFHGGSSGELFYSPVLSIIDNDIAGWIGRCIEGPTINDETLAVDLINQIGPIPGHYLGSAHTRDWWMSEQYIPSVADLAPYATWVSSGKRDTIDLAKERMRQILDNHKPKPLTTSQERVIEDVLIEAREYFHRKGMISDDQWTRYQDTLELVQ